MCGIFAYVGEREAGPVVLRGLHNLEYRGYDSAGMVTITEGCLRIAKDAGGLHQVAEKHRLGQLPGRTGVGHVRWATHGAVTMANAHPHHDCHGRIALVHNGIIENHRELRARLDGRHTFVSETDTEVICHLIEERMEQGLGLQEAVFEVSRELEGSYAIVAISADEPGKMVGMRKDSPLVVGVGRDGNFLASDTISLLDETDRVLYVDNGQGVVLSRDSVTIMDSQGRPVDQKPELITWRWDQAGKGGHDFYMLKEILEQPEAVRKAIEQDAEQIMEMAIGLLQARQVVFTACGTSRYAALIGRYAFSKVGRKFSDVVMASEFEYFSDSVDRNTLVIAVSQSGETADVINGVRRAREQGATIFSLVNVAGSSLARMSDKVLYLNCGPEIGVAATKSFLAQLSIFYLIAFSMDNRLNEGMSRLRTIADLVETNLHLNGQEVPRIARALRDRHDFYYIARGINFATAGEGALKMKEIAYVHAEGMPAGELKHGTLALVEQGTPVVAICPRDHTCAETLSNTAETKARGAHVIGVSDHNDPMFDDWIKVPTVEEVFYPMVCVVPLQLLAYHSATARDRDPDKPRNLAKSVTVK